MDLLKQIENEQMAKLSAGKEIPDFQPGDTVVVNVKIVEGERSRVQAYEGVCIGRAGHAWLAPFCGPFLWPGIAFPQVGPARLRQPFGLGSPPRGDFGVIAGKKNLRDRLPLPHLRPGVLGVFQ